MHIVITLKILIYCYHNNNMSRCASCVLRATHAFRCKKQKSIHKYKQLNLYYLISMTARPTMPPWLRSSNALPASSKLYFLETVLERLKIPVSANLTNLGRSCLALPPYEPITFICSKKQINY